MNKHISNAELRKFIRHASLKRFAFAQRALAIAEAFLAEREAAAAEPTAPATIYEALTGQAPASSDAWAKYRGDFNSLTDDEVEAEVQKAEAELDRAEEWLEAVTAWKAAGKPRAEGE